ncbi:MAG: glycosyltransferase family 2 protein [Burkholderiaceae bacterium]
MSSGKQATVDQQSACSQQAAEVSIVLPVYNEWDVINRLHRRLSTSLSALDISYELLFVDDGSTDGSQAILSEITKVDPTVRLTSFDRHYGKEAALRSGLAQAAGKAVIIMDADLQDPPELVPRMLIAWRHGAEAVLMRPLSEGRTTLTRISRRLIDYGLKFIANIDLPEHRVDFMLYDRKVLTALNLTIDRKRYMKAIFSWMSVRQAVIDYERARRIAPTSRRFTPRPRKQRSCPLTTR